MKVFSFQNVKSKKVIKKQEIFDLVTGVAFQNHFEFDLNEGYSVTDDFFKISSHATVSRSGTSNTADRLEIIYYSIQSVV